MQIRRRWIDALQIEPGWQYVEANPQFLGLMNQILSEMGNIMSVGSPEAWLSRRDSISLPDWNPGSCGLELLVPFLAAGKKAIEREDLGAEAPPAEAVMMAFEAIAQREIDRMCRPCRIARSCPFAGRRPRRA